MKNVEKRIDRIVDHDNEYIFESIRDAAYSKPIFGASDCQQKKDGKLPELKQMLKDLVKENILS